VAACIVLLFLEREIFLTFDKIVRMPSHCQVPPEKSVRTRRVPTQEQSRKRVETILDAAAFVFAEAGFEAATTEAIAERAKTSIGSVYQFFPNKLALFTAVASRSIERSRVVIDELLAEDNEGKSWRDLLNAAIDRLVRSARQTPIFAPCW
jgi:AcrR family transcriptional regulator